MERKKVSGKMVWNKSVSWVGVHLQGREKVSGKVDWKQSWVFLGQEFICIEMQREKWSENSPEYSLDRSSSAVKRKGEGLRKSGLKTGVLLWFGVHLHEDVNEKGISKSGLKRGVVCLSSGCLCPHTCLSGIPQDPFRRLLGTFMPAEEKCKKILKGWQTRQSKYRWNSILALSQFPLVCH